VSGATVTVLGNTGNLKKTNYTFLGWATSSSATSAQYTQGNTFTISQNTTLYAVWKIDTSPTYTVAYNGNGSTSGTAPTDSKSPYISGSLVTVLDKGTLAKTNYAFLGWNSNQTQANNGTVQYTAGQTFTINANTTLYAVWIIRRTVTYNGNGNTSGTAPSDSNSPYNNGSTVTVLGQGSLVKTGYVFQGWATSSSGSVAYTQGQTFTITANTTLYAVWQTAPKYTVTYSGNGSTGGTVPTDSGQYQTGASVTVKANTGGLVKTDHTFLGWAKNSAVTTPEHTVNGNTVNPSTFLMDSSNVTLYAIWSPNNSGGGGGFDGGVITKSLEIKCKFPPLLETWADVSAWMNKTPGNLPDYSAFLRFININAPLNLSTDIYGIAFKDEYNENVAGIGINDSLLVRKNLYAKKGGIGTLSVPSSLQVSTIESFTGQPIKVKAESVPNEDDKWVDVQPLRFSMASPPTQYDDFTVIRIGKGGLQFIDTGGMLTVTPASGSYPTVIGTFPDYDPPPYNPQNSVVNLFCTKISPTTRTPMKEWRDPVLVVDKAFYVEKDFSTHGFMSTLSDPQKGTGGGAIMMGQGFLGKHCPPEFALIGLMLASDASAKEMFSWGTSFPASPKQNQCFYRTDYGEVFRYVNGSWQSIGTVGTIGKYPTTYQSPNALWWYDAITKKLLCKHPQITGNVEKVMFNNVHSGDLDTLFLVRGEGMEQQYAANLYLGSLTATKTIYVDNIKHLDGSNWSFSGSGGNSSMRAGQSTTDSNGTKTISFPPGTFTSTPIVTATVIDNSNQAYTIKVTEVTKNDFTVKIFRHRHRHFIGNTGTSYSFNAPYYIPTDFFVYEPGAQHANVGGLVAPGNNISGHNIFAGYTDESCFSGVGAQPSAEPVDNVKFNWIATPSNQ